MAGIGMNGNEALRKILDYVRVANQAVNEDHNDKMVIRLTENGAAHKVEKCTTDSVKGLTHWVRSGENKHLNNETRNDFRDCVLRLFGKEKLSELPKNVQEILLPSKFEHTGKPLTASRILKVFNHWVDNTFKAEKAGRDEYVKIMLDPEYRTAMANQARARGCIERLLQNPSVDLNEKCPCTTVAKLCALHGDIGNKVPGELEKLGLKSCGVNYADNTCAGGGMLVWNTQEEKLIGGMSPDVFALLLDENKLEVGYDDVQQSAVFHYTDSLTGGLSPADDPFLLVFKRNNNDGEERTVLNMAMPNLSYKMSSFDKNNFCIRMLDAKKREFSASYDKSHQNARSIAENKTDPNEKQEAMNKYYAARQKFVKEQMVVYTDKSSEEAAKTRKNFGIFAEKFHKLINKDAMKVVTPKVAGGIVYDYEWKQDAPRTPLGFNEKESKLAMMLAEYGGSAMGVDLVGDDVDIDRQAKNAIAKAAKIVKAQQKQEAGNAELTAEDLELLAIRDKAQQNYEDNLYEEFAKGIIKARKMGLKALPMGKIGCGVFGNEPQLIGKMLAKAFLDYGGDMILVANGYADSDNDIANAVIESFNTYLKANGREDELLTLDKVNDKKRLEEIAAEIVGNNPPESNNELPGVDNNQNQVNNLLNENDFNLLEPNGVVEQENNNVVQNQAGAQQNANEINLLGRESEGVNRESNHEQVNNNVREYSFPAKELYSAPLPKPKNPDPKAQAAGKDLISKFAKNSDDKGKFKDILQYTGYKSGQEMLYGPLSYFAGNMFFGENHRYVNEAGKDNISHRVNSLNSLTKSYKQFNGGKKDQIKALLYDYRNLLMDCVKELADKSVRDRIENQIYGFLSDVLTRLETTDEQEIPNYSEVPRNDDGRIWSH